MKRFFFGVVLILVVKLLFATPVESIPIKVTQPNGDSITIVQYGDEYGMWYETLDGYVVGKNSSNYWVYVNASINGNLILTNQIVNSVSSPTGINLTNVFNAPFWFNISSTVSSRDRHFDASNSQPFTACPTYIIFVFAIS